MLLTSLPQALVNGVLTNVPVTVSLLGDGQTIASSSDPRFDAQTQSVTFDSNPNSPDW